MVPILKKQCIEWWIWQILVMIINVLRISPHKQCPVLIKKCYCILTCKWTKVCFVFRGPCRGVSGVHLGRCLQHGVRSVSAGGGRERDPHPQVHRRRPLSQGQAQRGPPQHQDQLLLLPFRGQSSLFFICKTGLKFWPILARYSILLPFNFVCFRLNNYAVSLQWQELVLVQICQRLVL